MLALSGWAVFGWACVLGASAVPLGIGIGAGLAAARALWIGATLSALPSGDEQGDA